MNDESTDTETGGQAGNPDSGADTGERSQRAGDRSALAAGFGAGLGAWLIGYVLTYLVVAPDVRDSPVARIAEALGADPSTDAVVGWVFYNAHFVDTVVRDVPIVGSQTVNYVGGDGFTPLLYLVPIGSLLLAGFAIAWYRDARTPTAGARAGLFALVGYLPVALVGLFVFAVTIGGATGAPDRLTGVVVAGLLYPLVWGGAGGAIAGLIDG